MPRNKGKGRKRINEWQDRNNVLDMQNARFEKYYKAQNIIPEEEWDAFMHALRQPLPSTFRIAGHRQMKTVLGDAMHNMFIPELEKARFNGEPVPVPRSIPWYPEGLAWHLSIARKELRRSPEYKRFHSFLVYETEVGNISRQEAVSMIPPLFLDVRPHHFVIDMCAAPGSKTSQLLEAMDPPNGLLIANDADHKRAHLLVHTSARLSSPVLMVTNLDASLFPSIKYRNEPLRFDRILADVPCSGDGTIRKNIGIWRTWSPMEGNGLHSLQLRILQRAMRLLGTRAGEDKSRIVYSTCSLNPVENEAVIAAALNSIPGFELVDVSSHLPNLIRRPGLTTWRPAVNRDVDLSFASHSEYCESLEAGFTGVTDAAMDVDDAVAKESKQRNGGKASVKGKDREQVRNRMLESHWPPANADQLGLERCLRIYPHLQDTGGFFVAVLQRKEGHARNDERSRSKAYKSKTVRKEDEARLDEADEVRAPKRAKLDLTAQEQEDSSRHAVSATTPDEGQDSLEPTDVRDIVPSRNPDVDGTFKENPFTFISEDDPNLVTCIERLRVAPSFPRSNIYVRNPAGDPVRSLYLVNDAVRVVMSETDYTKIRLISAGVKLFGRSELAGSKRAQDVDDGQPKIHFRVLYEGLHAVLPFIDPDSFVEGDASALRVLLKDYYPLVSLFEDPFRSTIEARPIGSHVARFVQGDYGSTRLTHDLILPLWKSDVSVSLMIDKKAKSALSLRLFGEDITFVGRQAATAGAQKAIAVQGKPTDEKTREDTAEEDNAEDEEK